MNQSTTEQRKAMQLTEAAKAVMLAEILGDIRLVSDEVKKLQALLHELNRVLDVEGLTNVLDELKRIPHQKIAMDLAAAMSTNLVATIKSAATEQVKAAAHKQQMQIQTLLVITAALGGFVLSSLLYWR